MNVKLEKSQICGQIEVPPSKSQAHRVMIASFLAGADFDFGLLGDDVSATKECLCALKQLFDGETDCALLDAGESGSTLRFLLPIVCALGANAEFVGRGRLPERPIGELLDVLRAHGAKIVGDKLPLKILSSAELCLADCGLQAGEYKIDGRVSSQYITGLLFALPLLDGDSQIVIDGELVSKNYVDLTIDTLLDFGVKVERTKQGFFVKGNQKYFANHVKIEGDWSSAAFPLALGLLAGEVKATNIMANSKQADKAFFDIARAMDGDIEETKGGFVARKSELNSVEFDAKNCPDVVPIVSVLCAFAKGISKISGVDRLKQKESDRLEAVRELLLKLGVKTEYAKDTLTVFGGAEKINAKDIKIDSFNDHRIAMSGIVAGLAVGEVEVEKIECIAKSYPTFIHDIQSLGANVR